MRVADGDRSISTGPLLLLEVDGHRPGDYTHDETRPNSCRQVTARCEVTPLTASK